MAGMFKAYDIWGLYPQEINKDAICKIGCAFARYLGKQRIVIRHDMRDSSSVLNRAFCQGAQTYGADLIDISLTTTPMPYTAIIDSGILSLISMLNLSAAKLE